MGSDKAMMIVATSVQWTLSMGHTLVEGGPGLCHTSTQAGWALGYALRRVERVLSGALSG